MPTITTTYQGDMSFAATLGEHTLAIDVPADLGGKNRGPTPPEIFVAALSSCVAASVTIHCVQSGLDPEGLAVDVAYAKAEKPARLVDLKITVRLPNAECGDQERAVREVIEHALVRETIMSDPEMPFELLDRTALAIS